MARPIVWALGILATTTLSSIGAGDRIMRAAGLSANAPAGTSAGTASGASAGASTSPSGAPAGPRLVTLNADLRGHYTAHPMLNGQRVRTLVDTGASLVALSAEDAAMIGLRVPANAFTIPLQSANGVIKAAPVRIDEIRLGDITVRGVEAVVVPRGLLGTSLLGMSFLRRLNGFEVASGRLTLRG